MWACMLLFFVCWVKNLNVGKSGLSGIHALTTAAAAAAAEFSSANWQCVAVDFCSCENRLKCIFRSSKVLISLALPFEFAPPRFTNHLWPRDLNGRRVKHQTALSLTFAHPRGHIWPDGLVKISISSMVENDLTPSMSRLIKKSDFNCPGCTTFVWPFPQSEDELSFFDAGGKALMMPHDDVSWTRVANRSNRPQLVNWDLHIKLLEGLQIFPKMMQSGFQGRLFAYDDKKSDHLSPDVSGKQTKQLQPNLKSTIWYFEAEI